MAAVAATGVFGLAGIGAASAEETGCVVSHPTGTPENREPNFRATADRAEFEFPAPIRTLFNEVVLVPAAGSDVKEGQAILKATASRQGSGLLAVEKIEIHWPLTAVKQGDTRRGVIALSHQQNIPVGIVLSMGLKELGSIVFAPGEFEPMRESIDFDAQVSQLIHDSMMQQQGFSMRLRSGGTDYSVVQPETYAYVSFIQDKLIPAMNEARRQDVAGSCKSP